LLCRPVFIFLIVEHLEILDIAQFCIINKVVQIHGYSCNVINKACIVNLLKRDIINRRKVKITKKQYCKRKGTKLESNINYIDYKNSTYSTLAHTAIN
jgi:hypothetical protein